MPSKTKSPKTSSVTHVAFVTAFLMILQQVGGKSTRDVLFLSNFPATDLPKAVLLTALLSLPAALGTSRLLTRLGPKRSVPSLILVNALLFLFEFSLINKGIELTPWLIFVHVGLMGSLTISSFWSVINERFDPHTAKQVVGRIGAGAALGGLAGGAISERVASAFGASQMLIVLAAVSALTAYCVYYVCPERSRRGEPEPKKPDGILPTPYLRRISLLVALTALTAVVIDYAMKAQAARSYTDEQSLMSFFAVFYTAANVLTFVLQSSLSSRLLERVGIGGTLALLPGSIAVLGTVGALVPRLWSLAVLKGLETVFANSFFRSAYELLYTPLPPDQKRSHKALIDVASDRLGDAVGSGLVLLVLFWAPEQPIGIFLGIAVAVALLSAYMSFRLHRGYISELATSLRSGAVRLRDTDALDATTRYTLSQTAGALDREELLAQIAELRARRGSKAAAPSTGMPQSSVKSSASADASFHSLDSMLPKLNELCSGDLRRIERALANGLDWRFAPILIELLSCDPLSRDVASALEALGARITGQLVDALLDPKTPFASRRRLPHILQQINNGLAARGLTDALNDDRFEVRYRAGRALLHIAEQSSELTPPRKLVLNAVAREFETSPESWDKHRMVLDNPSEDSVLDDTAQNLRSDRRLLHVFTLLSLAIDVEAIQLALRALASGEPKLRGTALEYLENVIPEGIRAKLWPHLEHRPASQAGQRTEEELLHELRSSAVNLDVKALRASARHSS